MTGIRHISKLLQWSLGPCVALLLFLAGGCHLEKNCYVKEISNDGGPDAFVPWWQLDGSTNPNCPTTNACGGCSVLAIVPETPCGNCGGTFVCDTQDAVRCSDPCMEIVGCADGEREAFKDATAFPDVAACSGGWSEKGILHPQPKCGHLSGDDSLNPEGIGCSAADLCAEGWRVCDSIAELAASSPTGCAATDFPPDTFYAVSVSGDGGDECQEGETNDLFGCGTVGRAADANCAPLDRASGDECDDIPGEFDCPGSWLIGSSTEAEDVRKNGPGGGGVICCRIQE